jgi:peptidyl-tRNA hydrolase, PTH1 family
VAIGNRQYLIVGLGNPGAEYEWSRHNLGFMLIDKLGKAAGVTKYRRECQSLIARADIGSHAVTLVKPQTYMNLSGEAVSCLFKKLETTPSELIVISDDLALPFGKIRIRARGTSGGHNGLKSISGALGTDEFTRLRIGIQPDHPLADSKKFVLDVFPMTARATVEETLEKSAEAVRTILADGVLKAMTEFNSNE